MIRKPQSDTGRHRAGIPYLNAEMSAILNAVEQETNDHALAQSIYFSPTALTHIKRLISMGGSIITDTTLVANDIDISLLGGKGAKVLCFIDDPQVISLAEHRRVTRAEIAVDYGLSVPVKLMVVGSAPAAINRMIFRRQHEPMSDVCVLAAPSGFASVVQLKERLLDSDLASIIARGKKGGIGPTVAIINAILREISRENN